MFVVAIPGTEWLVVSALGEDDEIGFINLTLAATIPEAVHKGRPTECRYRIPVALVEAAETDEMNCAHRYTPQRRLTSLICLGEYPAASALA